MKINITNLRALSDWGEKFLMDFHNFFVFNAGIWAMVNRMEWFDFQWKLIGLFLDVLMESIADG